MIPTPAICCALLALVLTTVHASETVFLPGPKGAAQVDVLYVNRSDVPEVVTPTATLTCPGSRACQLQGDAEPFELAPASARLLRYAVPETPAEVAAVATAPAAIDPEHETVQAAESQIQNTALQNFAGARFAPHEPMYFLFNGNGEDARFQFSFRYQIFDPDSVIAQRYPWLGGLRFAYTQTSLWDLSADSTPFYDTSYKPELFYERANFIRLPFADRFDLALGFRHESNGKGGDESRDLNQLFLTPTLTWGDVNGHHLVFSPVFAAYVTDMDNNKDIADYRGHVDWRFRAGDGQGLTVGSLARIGNSGKAGAQVDIAYPLKALTGLDLFAYLQYWKGYSETLRTYNQKTEGLRIGVGLVR
ncbi:phospholipase A [Chitinolyticbacter albus]|uniref:phospholipase A n=1 Tax=Chitinolyticbacter albus TaxID=2961951 RepID=UPI00210A6DD0|nr:phospholipase A [Chitinolyticbacter albus]